MTKKIKCRNSWSQYAVRYLQVMFVGQSKCPKLLYKKYATIKVYVTERNDVIKRHGNVITIWQKNLHSETKGVQEKESVMGLRGRQENLSLRITVWHHLASFVMPDSDPWQWIFLSTPHTNDRSLYSIPYLSKHLLDEWQRVYPDFRCCLQGLHCLLRPVYLITLGKYSKFEW